MNFITYLIRFQVVTYRVQHPWFMNNILFHFSPIKRDYDRCVKFIGEFVDKIIKSKIVESDCIGSSAKANNTDDENVYQTPKSILEILLQNSHEISVKQIRDEIFTIISGKYLFNDFFFFLIYLLAFFQGSVIFDI